MPLNNTPFSPLPKKRPQLKVRRFSKLSVHSEIDANWYYQSFAVSFLNNVTEVDAKTSCSLKIAVEHCWKENIFLGLLNV